MGTRATGDHEGERPAAGPEWPSSTSGVPAVKVRDKKNENRARNPVKEVTQDRRNCKALGLRQSGTPDVHSHNTNGEKRRGGDGQARGRRKNPRHRAIILPPKP